MFNSIDTWFIHLLDQLLDQDIGSQASRDGDVCGEIIGYSAKLSAAGQCTLLMNDVRNVSAAYAAAEVLWYMGGSGAIAMLQEYAPSYRKYASGEVTYGAYGPRLFWTVETEAPLLYIARDILAKDPNSRQAVVTIWHPEDLWAADQVPPHKDIPCTLTLQFIARKERLNLVVNMRSNDAWLGFPLDVFAFTCIQRLMACELDLKIGDYTHNVGSMHLYSRFKEKAEEAAKYRVWGVDRALPNTWLLNDSIATIQDAVEVERSLREDKNYDPNIYAKLGDMSRDLVKACASKTCVSVIDLMSFKSGAFNAVVNRERRRAKAVSGERAE